MLKWSMLIVPVALLFSVYVYASSKRKLKGGYSLDKFPDMKSDIGFDLEKLADKY